VARERARAAECDRARGRAGSARRRDPSGRDSRAPRLTKPADSFGMASLHNDAYHVAKEQVLATFEKEYVTRLVARAAGNMSRAARLANVDRTTLYRLLERHGFRRDGLGSSQA